MVSKAQHDIRRKRQVLDYAAQHGNVRKTCRHFGIPRSLFYLWRGAHTREGDAGLSTSARALGLTPMRPRLRWSN